jgi:hypothetical protein
MTRTDLLATALVLSAGVFSSIGEARAAEFKLPETDATPAELVDAALRSELDGQSEVRKTLLDRALKLDAEFAPARWHSGYVRYDGKWLSPDEVAALAAGDSKRAEYRKRRDTVVDRAEDHRELARWCRKNGLADEARVHWAKVLEFNPQDADAIASLGLQLHEGQLLTKQQIATAKKLAGEQMQALKRWQPQVVEWRKAIENLKGHDYDFALHELRKFNDPEAIPALEAAFAVNSTGPKAEALNLALVDTVGRMPGAAATAVLLRRALLSPSNAVATAAADALAKRPKYAYVPQLIANLPSGLKSQFHVTALPGGGVIHEHELQLETAQGTMVLNLQSTVQPVDAAAAARVTPTALANEQRQAEAIEANVAAIEQSNEMRRQRINDVLKRATGFDNAEDTKLWTTVYAEYYGWSVPQKSNVVMGRTLAQEQVFYTLPAILVQRPEVDVNARRENSSRAAGPQQPFRVNMEMLGILGECFAAGAPVLTLDGSRPIEQLQSGDRVLSQNVETGELEYKTVLRRTLRRGAELMELTLGTEKLVVTPGHPFFVVGKGWQVTKHLQAGDRLATANGSVAVDQIQSCANREVYNLVVSDFGTFFVGERRLLAHDDLPIRETATLLPGLSVAGIK